MKILVTGSNGMLGEAIQKNFTDDKLILTDIKELDVREINKQKVSLFPKIDLIVHLAALTDLELCEQFPKQAYYTNTIGTFNMVELARQKNIPIVYISTAGVFDGNFQKAYIKNDTPCPINHYGKSKYYGELAVQSWHKHYIFRQSWSFGGGKKDKKFVIKIVKQIRAGYTTIAALPDYFGSPTYTMDTAKIIHDFIDKERYGLYHIETGRASRLEVAQEIVNILKPSVKVISMPENSFPSYTTSRSKNETLEGIKIRNWKEALKEYLSEL